jgi:hypothetical protein
VVGRCHAEESLHVVDPGVFAGLLPPDGEVDNSVQVSEMFDFLNLTLQSFGPENFVSLVQIGKFQKGLI